MLGAESVKDTMVLYRVYDPKERAMVDRVSPVVDRQIVEVGFTNDRASAPWEVCEIRTSGGSQYVGRPLGSLAAFWAEDLADVPATRDENGKVRGCVWRAGA